MRKIVFIAAFIWVIAMPSWAYVRYQDNDLVNGNNIEVEETTGNTGNVYVNGNWAGSYERIPTSQDTMDKINRRVEKARNSFNNWDE